MFHRLAVAAAYAMTFLLLLTAASSVAAAVAAAAADAATSVKYYTLAVPRGMRPSHLLKQVWRQQQRWWRWFLHLFQ